MVDFNTARRIIEEELNKLQLDRPPEELYEPVRYILDMGGKRIRPALALMACSLFSDTLQPALKPALAIELFHNFTLLHDDIMDRSKVRRGRPTVHEKWNTPTAILSGDVMSILSYRILSESEGTRIGELLEIFNRTALQVCEGQQLDMNFENRMDVSVEEYLHMAELKTAVLIAASLKAGAISAGAGIQEADLLYEFGRNLGIAFQLRDDYLDVFGDPEKFGKKAGNDIITGKKTFLLIKALELAPDETGKRLKRLIAGRDMAPEARIREVVELYKRLGVGEISSEMAGSYYRRSRGYLERVGVAEQRKAPLAGFAADLMQRGW